MAAVTSPPPAISSSSKAIPRKPVALLNLSHVERPDWSDNAKSAAADAQVESPRLRKSPLSPVQFRFLPDGWAQPFNVDIETCASEHKLHLAPEAALPSPHSPRLKQVPEKDMTDEATDARHASSRLDKPLPMPSDQGAEAVGLEQTHDRVEPEDSSVEEFAGQDDHRNSRESETGSSTSRHQASFGSSAFITSGTSASSLSGTNETSDSQCASGGSPGSSVHEDGLTRSEPVPRLQYHDSNSACGIPLSDSTTVQSSAGLAIHHDTQSQSTPVLQAIGGNSIGRLLTPNRAERRSSLTRPQSSYSLFSDLGRGRSPGQGSLHNRAASTHSRRSPERRPISYAELLNVPYPQPPPASITFDNSQLRNAVGNNASLLSAQKTLEMYRQNVKKTNDASIQYSFATCLISTAQEQGLNFDHDPKAKSSKPTSDAGSPTSPTITTSPHDLVREARAILQRLSYNGYPFAQYYLADGFASGLFNKGKEDYNSGFPLFVHAAKHGHAESAYRAALCYEFGWGCRKDPTKAVQFLRTAAAKRHPGAMTRLGKACLSGDLGETRYREGIRWLERASQTADEMYNLAPYHLGSLYETGYGDDVIRDEGYAAKLFTQAASLGHAEANFRMGDAYEHGKLNCPRDPTLSVHFYTGAAQRGHVAAMMCLCAWYMVGAAPILDRDEEEAYQWARQSAELGYAKAQYAVGYFTEMGIGCRSDMLEANVWYVEAATAGDERAKQRLSVIQAAMSGGKPMEVGHPRNRTTKKSQGNKDDKECVVM